MSNSEFWKSTYSFAAVEHGLGVSVQKISGSDWVSIGITQNDVTKDAITVKSKQQAEHLYFMLGQALGKG